MRITNYDHVFEVGDYAVIDFRGNTSFIVCIDRGGKPDTYLVGDHVRDGSPYAASKLGYACSYLLTNDSRPSRKTLRAINDFLHTDLGTILHVLPEHYRDVVVDDFIRRWRELYPEGVCETEIPKVELESFICDRYDTTHEYVGISNYHSEREYNQPFKKEKDYMIGVELEVEFKSLAELSNFTDKPSNWFMRERDSSLNSLGCEIITTPMNPSDAKDSDLWETVCSDILMHAKAWDSPRCGLHVHIGREIFKGNDEGDCIAKMLYLYHHFLKNTGMNTNIFGRSVGYREEDGKTETSVAAALLGSVVLRDEGIKNKVKKEVIAKSVGIRNMDINITNDDTIEFRKGKASINANRIVAVVEYCELICKYAIRTPWQQISLDDFKAFLKVSNISEKLKKYVRL